MINQEIQTWLDEEGGYRDGLRLYKLTGGGNVGHYEALSQRPYIDQQAKAEIADHLRSYLLSNPVEPHTVPAENRRMAVEVNREPGFILDLRAKAVPFHKQRSHLKALLIEASVNNPDRYTNEERYDLCWQIMKENVPALDRIYDQIRDWEEDGIAPPTDMDQVKQETVDKMKQVFSLRPQISRLKKKIEQAQGDEKKSLEEEYDQKVAQLRALEEDLGL